MNIQYKLWALTRASSLVAELSPFLTEEEDTRPEY